MNIMKLTINLLSLIKYLMLTGYIFSANANADAEDYENITYYSYMKTSYLNDVTAINNKLAYHQFKNMTVDDGISTNIDKNHTAQNKAGIMAYKIFSDTKKVKNQIINSTIIMGLDYLEIGDIVTESIDFIKDKTKYQFGECSSISLHIKNIKSKSCLTKYSSIEFNSNYKMDLVQINFKLSL